MEMMSCRRNPKGWADVRRGAALLVVAVLPSSVRLLLAPRAARTFAQRGHGDLRDRL